MIAPRFEKTALVLLLALVFGVRVFRLDQPILENDVGRQIPTAMVARNLDRGGSFGRPELDTGPFPNLFLVEPPLYQVIVVGLHRAVGLGLTESGRLVSAVGLTLAALAIYLLVRPRAGPEAALLSLLAIGSFPVTIRYGRAFQPDALMIGCATAGLACWDRASRTNLRGWLLPAWAYLAAGCALKVTAGAMVLPVALAISWSRGPGSWKSNAARAALLGSALIPAVLWYVHAAHVLATTTEGSTAAKDSGAIWLSSMGLAPWLNRELLMTVARSLAIRAFGPIGFFLAVVGLFYPRIGPAARLAFGWIACVLLGFAALGSKMHHEYYWLAAAPPVAILVGRALAAGLSSPGRGVPAASQLAAFALATLGTIQAADTFRTPPSWQGIERLARAIRAVVPENAERQGRGLIAREAVLFQADRRGFRLETTPDAARRAAGEWGLTLDPTSVDLRRVRVSSSFLTPPISLVDRFRSRGAGFVADLCYPGESRRDHELHNALRDHYTECVSDPSLVLFRLDRREN